MSRLRIDERRNVRERRTDDEIQVQPDAQPRPRRAAARSAASAKAGVVTIIDADDTVPAAWASRIPRFTPGAKPEVVRVDDENAHDGECTSRAASRSVSQ